jgi:hypothetical protein
LLCNSKSSPELELTPSIAEPEGQNPGKAFLAVNKRPKLSKQVRRVSRRDSWANPSFIYCRTKRSESEQVRIIKIEIKKVTFFDLPY